MILQHLHQPDLSKFSSLPKDIEQEIQTAPLQEVSKLVENQDPSFLICFFHPITITYNTGAYNSQK
jgi:hypothetical protein